MRFYGRDEMQIVQTLETINVNTDDINVFQYFKD
ncbi:adenylosuccinate lyase, partial [Campylobacter coli]|nr:adenylosuccinate lyase [Campylobacter coli]EAI9642070.1 adenylosuccinate lyase [Campylobacter coli]EAJ9262322.1 adenylosuccinate lyase [Campylobacter coli]EAL2379618.1 adenylosuccinate lyase [Campylobacter coli]EAV9740408.1 adenylosuccinate lyase [Campylobacter coli]